MIGELFAELENELLGLDDVSLVRTGAPVDTRAADIDDTGDDGEITVFLSFLNLEVVDRVLKQGRVRIMITAYYEESADAENTATEAVGVIDEVIQRLAENPRQYVLVATPEHTATSIWSSLRVGPRPFLIYECPIPLP